jgi:hypothetical protein
MKVFTSIEPWIWLAGLLVFLLVYAAASVLIVNKQKKTASAGRLASIYLALKVIRLLVFIGTILIYLQTVKIETKRFVLAAAALYLVYLVFDTLFLAATEKQLKKK